MKQIKSKIVAEAGCNHNGNIKMAFKMVDAAKKANADAIKFQSFKADQTVTKSAKKAKYAKLATKKDQSQYEMQKSLELSDQEHVLLKKYCKQKKIEYLSSAFDITSLDFLYKLKINQFKIPSGEIVNYPYLKKSHHLKKK